MRNFTLTCLLIATGFAATAQFRIQPQLGVDNTKTSITYNDQSFVPSGMQFSPKLGLRMEYTFKKGHGIFAGISTSAPAIDFEFSDMQSAANSYNTARQNLQMRFEGGYQFSTKPISLSKKGSTQNAFLKTSGRCGERSFGKCGGHERASCGSKMSCGKQSAVRSCSKNSEKSVASKASYLRIIPSAGFAFIPAQPSVIESKLQGGQNMYTYKAGAWNTALIAGAGFEFGSGKQAKFMVSINYLKGLDNMETQTINSVSNGKSIASMVSSASSGWSISLGVPLSFSKIRPDIKRRFDRFNHNGRFGEFEKFQSHGRCGQYRMQMH